MADFHIFLCKNPRTQNEWLSLIFGKILIFCFCLLKITLGFDSTHITRLYRGFSILFFEKTWRSFSPYSTPRMTDTTLISCIL